MNDEPSDGRRAATADANEGALPATTRVLVVDDEEDNAQLLALWLDGYGVQTRCAHSGAQGLEAARAWRPHIALLDLRLPDMSGSELAANIRAELGDATALIAITGLGERTPEERAHPDAFVARLVKPVDMARLQALLTEYAG